MAPRWHRCRAAEYFEINVANRSRRIWITKINTAITLGIPVIQKWFWCRSKAYTRGFRSAPKSYKFHTKILVIQISYKNDCGADRKLILLAFDRHQNRFCTICIDRDRSVIIFASTERRFANAIVIRIPFSDILQPCTIISCKIPIKWLHTRDRV